MKNSILFILLISSLNFFKGNSQTYNHNNKVLLPVSYNQIAPVPDVMGNINVIQNNGRKLVYNISESDSFPVFPGFPKAISGSTFEGGIICNMDSDPDLEIVYNIGFTIQTWNYDGSSVPGWPQTVSSYRLEGAPSFGDIDGDGQEEIVVSNHGGTSGGFIYAYHKNGTPVSGFPVTHGYSTRTPVLANIDNTGGLEIIVNRRESNEVWVYSGTGVVYPGWPKPINHVPASSAAVGDITGDSYPEIIAESYSSLYAWDRNGNLLTGFPYTMPNGDVNSYSSPTLADLDGDNLRDIVFGTHVLAAGGYVYALKNNATLIPGWPKQTNYWIYSPPSVGFIDGDNVLDVAIGDGGGTISGTPIFSLYAWNKNGAPLSGFPVGSLWSINNQVSLADVDNDNQTELIIDDNTQSSGSGKYPGFKNNGTQLSGNWPIYTSGTTFFSTPMFWDLNRDGILDIAGTGTASSITNVYIWNTGITFNSDKITTPMWQYNSRHNGVYGDNGLVGITPISKIIPKSFRLWQNYPNPFNPVTKIRFDITEGFLYAEPVQLIIYDINGKEAEILINEQLDQGEYEVSWNASNYPSGVYFYKLRAGSFTETRKMILIK